MNKYFKISRNIFIFSFIYWVSYNTYFGWNYHSESELETLFDTIYNMLLLISLYIYFKPLGYIYRAFVSLVDEKLTKSKDDAGTRESKS